MNRITINTASLQGTAQKASAESPSNTAGNTVNKYIYGHFAEHLGRCIYEGIWVGTNSEISNIEGYRTDVIEALRELEIPVLRWPGGCFADEYHWKDGVGPYEERKRMVNTHWGGVVENNHFGTHEFLRFCELIHTEPYICGNVGSGTVQEMSEWVEYMTFAGESPMANWRRANGKESPWPLTYFGVGNENWGCGGNMTAEYYADLFRRYATYVRNYDGNQVQKIAGGPNVDDFHWTETCMKKIPKGMMWGLSLHNYTFTRGWDDKGNATGFTEEEWYQVLKDTLRMDLLIQKHSEIMDKYDPDKQVALVIDEWGTWFNVEPDTNPGFLYQQNTIRDALLAAVNFNIFHKYCDRVQMTNIAQMINVLQAVILTDNEKMIKTPTYHAFHMYKVHKEAEVLPLELVTHQVGVHTTSAGISGASMGVAPTGSKSAAQDDIKVPALSATATRNSKGVIHISLCNLSTTEPQSVACAIAGLSAQTAVTGTILSANSMDSHNTFDNPTAVAPMDFHGFSIEDSKLHIELPPMSVVTLSVG